jgi:hypothetical protein
MVRLLAGAVVALAAFVAPGVALACSCVPVGPPCAGFSEARAVFVGTVQARVDAKESVTATIATGSRRGEIETTALRMSDFRLAVGETFSGDPGREVVVRTAPDTAMCGFPFEVGRSYLVYASRDDAGRYGTSICSRTRPLEGAEDDLSLLRQMQAGKVVSRTFGRAYRLQLQVKGAYMRHDDLGPMAGVTIVAHGAGVPSEVKTDAAGRFVFEGLTPGRYELEPRWPPGMRSMFGRREAVTVGPCGAADIGFPAITDAPLSGTLNGPDGAPAGAQVQVTVVSLDPAGSFATDAARRSTIAFTDKAGRWVFDGLPPGRYLLGVNLFGPPSITSPYLGTYHPTGKEPDKAVPVDVAEGRQVRLALTTGPRLKTRTISGVVADDQGVPVKGAYMRVVDTEFPLDVVFGTHGETDDAGRFTVKALEGRRYFVQAVRYEPKGLASATVKDSGDVANLKMVVKPR